MTDFCGAEATAEIRNTDDAADWDAKAPLLITGCAASTPTAHTNCDWADAEFHGLIEGEYMFCFGLEQSCRDICEDCEWDTGMGAPAVPSCLPCECQDLYFNNGCDDEDYPECYIGFVGVYHWECGASGTNCIPM